MTTFEAKTKLISDEIYTKSPQQIVIDLVQKIVEDLFNPDEPLKSDNVGSAVYNVSILREVYNPLFESDCDFLLRLEKALEDWQNDMEQSNKILGLPFCA